jgi:hypothetical protein
VFIEAGDAQGKGRCASLEKLLQALNAVLGRAKDRQ